MSERGPWFETLDEMDKTLKGEETERWRTPANRTGREYAARQARMAVEELWYKLAEYERAKVEDSQAQAATE